jgi:hypothetical protein
MSYRETEGLSGSMLKYLKRSPKHYKHRLDNPVEPTEAMQVGSLVHTLILEPEKFHQDYFVMPEGLRRDKRSKEYQGILSQHGNKTIVAHGSYLEALEIIMAVKSDSHAVNILYATTGEMEKPVIWQEEGVLCKGRLDRYLTDLQVVVDLKTTNDASPKGFSYTLYKQDYGLQLAHYLAGIKHTLGLEAYPAAVVIAVENVEPYAVQCYSISATRLDEAFRERSHLLEVYKSCLESGIWRAYEGGIYEI